MLIATRIMMISTTRHYQLVAAKASVVSSIDMRKGTTVAVESVDALVAVAILLVIFSKDEPNDNDKLSELTYLTQWKSPASMVTNHGSTAHVVCRETNHI